MTLDESLSTSELPISTTEWSTSTTEWPFSTTEWPISIVEEPLSNHLYWSIENCIDAGINITLDFKNASQIFSITNDTSVSCLRHKPNLTHQMVVSVIVIFVIAIASFIGNILTIISIKKSQRHRRFSRSSNSAIYKLILHLSIADLIVTAFCLCGEAAWKYAVAWYAGNAFCKIFKFMQMFGLYLSTFIMVLIGVDRYVAVKYPMKNLSNSKNGSRLLIFVYFLSGLLSFPQIFVFRESKGPFLEDFYQCVTHGTYTASWQEPLYTSMSLVVMFIIPLIILLWTYKQTFSAIAHSEKAFKEEVAEGGRRADLNRRRLIHRAKLKSLRLSIVIVFTFVIWWAPYYILMLICIFVDTSDHISESSQEYIFFFGMSNSVMNPLIYGAFQMYPDKKRNGQSFRDGSMMNYRSTISRASVCHGSTRVMTDRVPKTLKEESTIEEETNLMVHHNKERKESVRFSPGDFKMNNGFSSTVSPSCRKIVDVAVNDNNHINNGNTKSNGDIAKL